MYSFIVNLPINYILQSRRYSKSFFTKGDLLGRTYNQAMCGNRENIVFMTNLATIVDVHSKSRLMTLMCVVIIAKQTTSCQQLLLIRLKSKCQIDSYI